MTTDFGVEKILPDISFLRKWRDKIEAIIITHVHEDHIGAIPWVVPALDKNVPIYGGAYANKLVDWRLKAYHLA